MLKWLDTALEIQSVSPVDISAKCHISREAWYNWRQLPGFNEWFVEQWQTKRTQWLPTLDLIGMKRAPHSFQYWEAMKKTVGDLQEANSTNIYGDKVIAIMGGTSSGIKEDTTTNKQDT